MKRLVFLLVLLLAPLPAHAAADPDPLATILAAVDADPAAVIVLQPKGIGDALAWLQTLGGPIKPLIDETLRNIGVVGRPETLVTLGVDPTAPIVYAVHVINEKGLEPYATSRLYPIPVKEALLAVFAHARLVARVADAKKLEAFLGGVMKKDAKLDAYTKELGAWFVVARVRKTLVTVDVLLPIEAMSPTTMTSFAASVLRSPAPGHGADAILAHGAGARLRTASAALWIDPARAEQVAVTMGWQRGLEALKNVTTAADSARLFTALQQELAGCAGIREAAAKGPFTDAAVTVEVGPGLLTIGTSWGVRPQGGLAEALVTGDDGLVDVGTATSALMVGMLTLDHVGRLAKLARVGFLSGTLAASRDTIAKCGLGGWIGYAIGWPQLAATALSDKLGQDLFAAVRNVVFAFQSYDWQSGGVGALALSLDDAGRASMNALVASAIGASAPKAETVGGRVLEIWPNNPSGLTWLRTELGDGRFAYAVITGGRAALTWFFGSPSPRGAAGAPSTIGLLRVDWRGWPRSWPSPIRTRARTSRSWASTSGSCAARSRSTEILLGTIRIDLK